MTALEHAHPRGRPPGSKTQPKPPPRPWLAALLAKPGDAPVEAAPKPTLSLSETAFRVGLSDWRFRKVWEKFVSRRGFPSPLRQPPESNYAWDTASVETWCARRATGAQTAPADNDAGPTAEPTPPPALAPHTNPTLQRQRNELAAMMKKGA
ncbi:hypothetical protein [Caulobacter sp. BK020]|uniref:hypothetical protein n=1 Tax=Caulobacter sp. BK020 TaxID=2512117 RepID=UPI00104BBBDE|nr:hypothetical protein [Caulobacter sp. BK020]TCS14572.1 hypothetical protein EV278_107221 [Caulobacter sp. BK020]